MEWRKENERGRENAMRVKEGNREVKKKKKGEGEVKDNGEGEVKGKEK